MSNARRAENRLKTLKRRRDWLASRISDYRGKDMSRDRAEYSAIQWAVTVIENNFELALDVMEQEASLKDTSGGEDG